jgi:hypothetical protein
MLQMKRFQSELIEQHSLQHFLLLQRLGDKDENAISRTFEQRPGNNEGINQLGAPHSYTFEFVTRRAGWLGESRAQAGRQSHHHSGPLLHITYVHNNTAARVIGAKWPGYINYCSSLNYLSDTRLALAVVRQKRLENIDVGARASCCRARARAASLLY